MPAAHARARAHAGHERSPRRPAVGLAGRRCWSTPSGLVCLTGCHEHGIEDEATARRLLDAFGPDSLRVELQRPYAAADLQRNRARERLAREPRSADGRDG